MDTEAIGGRLRALRDERGLSQGDVAGAAGISVSMLSQLEHGHKGASVSTLSKLAAALGVSLSDLFREQPKKAV
jgi:transcriptional regulator with XRE-family HTH domain